jgi:hypothetical protein
MGGGSPAPPPLISQPAHGGPDQTGFDSQLKAAVEPGEESADTTEPSLRGTIFDFVCDIRCSLIKWAAGCLKYQFKLTFIGDLGTLFDIHDERYLDVELSLTTEES